MRHGWRTGAMLPELEVEFAVRFLFKYAGSRIVLIFCFCHSNFPYLGILACLHAYP